MLTATAATTASVASTATEKASASASLATANNALAAAQVLVNGATTESLTDTAANALALAQKDVALAKLNHAVVFGSAATAAKKAGDMVAYSGYDLNVAVSGATDNGTTFSMGFDMGAGKIADRDDDRAMDDQGATIGTSALTIGSGGMTYVIGQDKIDDLYDDSQNGDISVAGNMGGIAFTIVADLDKDTAATAASKVYKAAATARAAGAVAYNAAGVLINTAAATTKAIGDSDYTPGTYTDTAAVAAVRESTSLKVSGTAGAAAWSFVTTNKNDTGDAASALNLSFAASDSLSFAINHNTKGKAAAINKLTATYVMDAITLSLSAADDKDAAGQGGKASRNMSIGYAAGPMTATFATDEQSAWSVVGQYDLDGGAQAFATMDSTEFAVLGLSFAF